MNKQKLNAYIQELEHDLNKANGKLAATTAYATGLRRSLMVFIKTADMQVKDMGDQAKASFLKAVLYAKKQLEVENE